MSFVPSVDNDENPWLSYQQVYMCYSTINLRWLPMVLFSYNPIYRDQTLSARITKFKCLYQRHIIRIHWKAFAMRICRHMYGSILI